jgi:hypothetical protein
MNKEKQIFTVVHTHRHGTSIYVVRAARKPSVKRVVKKLKLDFEPDRDEFIDIDMCDLVVEM